MSQFVMLDCQTLPDADFHQEKEILSSDGITCILAECKTDEDVIAAAKDAEAIGVNYYRITEKLLSRLPNLKLVVRYGIGYDVVDVDACTRHGVLLCNLPHFCIIDVATHAMAFTMDLCRKVTVFNGRVRKGEWDVGYGYPTHRLSTRTIGLIGFGNIARQFRKFLAPFEPEVIAYDPYLDDQVFETEGVKKVSLDELLARADIISLHIPSIPETYHMISKESIAKMKDGVMIINTSRGPLVDIAALTDAILSGKVGAAGLDVVEGEPIRDAHHPMFQCENLIVNPHTSYNSVESSDDQHTQVAETVAAFFTGKKLDNIVNKQVLANK